MSRDEKLLIVLVLLALIAVASIAYLSMTYYQTTECIPSYMSGEEL